MLEQTLRDFDLSHSVDYDLALMKPQQTLAELSSRAITAIAGIIPIVCPDVVLVQGDTTTAYMAALAAFYFKIPVGHVEAGLRTHNIYSPFPEEVNRQSISTIATYNFAPTNHAAENLRFEGRRDNVYVTGNTVVDALMHMKRKPLSARVLGHFATVEKRAVQKPTKILLLTAHRREKSWKTHHSIFYSGFNPLGKASDIFVVYPIHLNPDILRSAEEYFAHRF